MDQIARQESLWLQAARQRRRALQLIRRIVVTHAAVADTNDFEELLDAGNTSRNVYADHGYPSIERETKLKQAG